MRERPLPESRTVIVTGATRGIGKAALIRFAQAGANVIGLYVSSCEQAASVEAECKSLGYNVRCIKCPVDDREAVSELMRNVTEEYGSIDVLVNNAGIARDQLTVMMSADQWDAVLQVNFRGTYHCCSEVLPYMLKQDGGSIVNVVSVSGLHGREAQLNYSASKGAVIGLTKLLARQYAHRGISINAVAPGMVETDMLDQLSAAKLEQFLFHTHVKRSGRPEEIAEGIFFLAGSPSSYMSGQVLKMDGGFLL